MFGNKKVYIVEFNGIVNDKNCKQFKDDLTEVARIHKDGDEAIIKMNCPGGSPALSEEIMEFIKSFNSSVETTMFVESMSASGGYYIASGIKKIYANKNAVIGSIGVILQKVEVSGLADKVGIQEDNLTVGDFKAPLSLFKPVDEEGEKYIKENLMDPLYKNFSTTIAKNRNIEIDELNEKFGGGRIFIASEVVGTLVDKITTLTELLDNNFKDHDAVEIDTKKKTFLEKIGFSNTIKFDLSSFKSNIKF